MLKDLELVVNAAQYAGVSMPLVGVAQQIYKPPIIAAFQIMTIRQF